MVRTRTPDRVTDVCVMSGAAVDAGDQSLVTAPDNEVMAELLAARKAIEDIRGQHTIVGASSPRPWCVYDGQNWPCPTTQALAGVQVSWPGRLKLTA